MTDTGETMGLRDAVWLAISDWLGKRWASPYDLVDAILAIPQLVAQQARIAELEGLLASMLKIADEIDEYQKRPGSGADGAECACCMGEMFDDGEREVFSTARAALRKDPQQ